MSSPLSAIEVWKRFTTAAGLPPIKVSRITRIKLEEESKEAYQEILRYARYAVTAEKSNAYFEVWLTEGRLQELCEALHWDYNLLQRSFRKVLMNE